MPIVSMLYSARRRDGPWESEADLNPQQSRAATRGGQRLVQNENDENTTTARTTRAKAAATEQAKQPLAKQPLAKQPLQAKKAGVNQNTRKRAALGDVSNVGKNDVVEGKKVAGKVAKAAQPTGVTKTSRTTTRQTLAVKETKKEVKRTGSGSGAIGVHKRKASAAAQLAAKEEASGSENEPLRKKAHTSALDKQSRAAATLSPIADSTKSLVAEEAEVEAKSPPPGVQELEEDDCSDPFMVSEYSEEIFAYLGVLEIKTRPNPDYMNDQDDLEWKMRGILVDWLIEVHHRFHLLPETLFLCINIIDRFLSKKVVRLDRLQLVGITALFIASKYEEVLSPHVSNFQRVTDDGYQEEEILEAERFILSTLNFDLSYPNPMNFLRRVSKADNYDFQTRSIGKYLTEISLLDHRFMGYRPSMVAAASMYLAREILDRGDWVSCALVSPCGTLLTCFRTISSLGMLDTPKRS